MKQDDFIYGIHSVQALLERSPQKIKKLLVYQQHDNKRLQEILLLAKTAHIPNEKLSRSVIEQQFPSINHQGVIAICYSTKAQTESDLIHLLDQLEKPAFLMILDGVQDPHNLGACLRTADAVGVDAVIIPKDHSVGLTATVHKVASGAVEAIPVIQVTNLARTMLTLKQKGIWLYGADAQTKQTIYQTNLSGAIALVFGAEGRGLRRLTQKHCDALMSIPMKGTVASLNISVAAAICLFEALRQQNST